ncbi:MAG: DUF4390 domain-containing protein [Nitrococcus sp.]|nr:DUF4390 domain-containing protein [Nitrococcus sp.]
MNNTPAHWRHNDRGRLLALLLVLVTTLSSAGADGIFRIRSGAISLHDGVYYLDAKVEYRLSDVAREALDSGVPLYVVLEIKVIQPHWWSLWWEDVVAQLTQRYRLQYHALSQRYVLTAINSGERRSFRRLRAMLVELGNVQGVPVIDAELLQAPAQYLVRARARLDLDALPRPLRTVVYLSPEWRLVSDWHQWQLGS